ncbi:MAG TPA: hypothetical protein PLE30_10030 [Candidatus Kapabacteria bacterium]|nr:hypothetical protein [Candidatus Kapabacteria bacterium]
MALHITIFFILGAFQMLLSQGTTLNSNGKINNLGTIRVKAGQVKLDQDTILGRVELLQKDAASQQAVPNMVFNQLILKNTAKKIVRDDRKGTDNKTLPLIVMDSLVIEDTANLTTRWIGWTPEDIQAKGTVRNEANYTGPKYLILNNNIKKQDILGKGEFSKLQIMNPYGVDVVSGGFKINEELLLREGKFRNSKANNFIMADSSLIVRYPQSSLEEEPSFDGVVSIHYKGNGTIITSGEIPSNPNTLKTLRVENTDSLILAKNSTVNDSLVIATTIITKDDTLSFNHRSNLFFDISKYDIEIVGNFRRNVIIPGDSIILNNPYTWIRFNSLADLGEIKSITSTILPSKFQPYLGGTEKVKRIINLNAYSDNGVEITRRFRAQFNYAWHHNVGLNNDESNGLNLLDLVLQRWGGDIWHDLQSSQPQQNPFGWAFAKSDSISSPGYYAIGPANINNSLVFRAYALLEGAYIPGSANKMRVDLWSRDILSHVTANEYPLNLLSDIKDLLPKSIPDSVVDYAVLEFKTERNGEAVYRLPIFIKYDGRLVDLFGNDRIKLKDSVNNNKFGGDYYVVIRHRNHAPIITEKPLKLATENNTLVYNFTDPKLIEGGSTSLKLVDYIDNKFVYAMKGGFIPYENSDLEALMNITMYYTNPKYWEESWQQFTNIGYIRSDYNLSGIITTKDFNISWNNRGK